MKENNNNYSVITNSIIKIVWKLPAQAEMQADGVL